MEDSEVKRRYQRHEYSSPLSLYRMDYQEQSSYAEMKDYSRGGMSLLSNEELVVGQLVYLKMKNYNESATGPEKCKSYSGSVKWINPCSSPLANVKELYKYGIEYYTN
ncbi:MAG: PilZ domain-containing protein [Desulfobacula sp.]|nr:PilZ domain-containing protein [Desulfobacula sp.]